jgi:hypothetical protein
MLAATVISDRVRVDRYSRDPIVLDIYRQHLDRDQVDTPELCSNKLQPGTACISSQSFLLLSLHASP